jgi:serine/threonine-protein kinase RsbW
MTSEAMLRVGDRQGGRRFADARAATPAAVPALRRSVAAFARGAGADEGQCEAIRLAVSEAVTNVVLHAYDADGGTVHVEAEVIGGEIVVRVGDDGRGLGAPSPYRGLGQGLSLIATMSEAIVVAPRPRGGTELRLRFALRAPHRSAAGHGPLTLSELALTDLAA